MAFGASMDLLTMTIPNRISIILALAFFAITPFAGLPFEVFLMHLGAGALVLVAAFILFAVGGFGGGDAKLLAAAALWIGFERLPEFLVYVAIFGGVLAVAILIFRGMPILPFRLPEWAIKLHQKGTGIPYGLAITAGALTVYPETHWFMALGQLAS